MTTDPGPSQDTYMQALRVLTLAHIGGVVLFGVVATVSIGGMGEYPSVAVAAGLFLANVVAFAVAEIWGYRAPAAPTGDDDAAHQIGQGVLRSTTIFRLVVTEAPAILALVIAFWLGSGWVYLAGAIWAVPSMVWHAYPSRRVLERIERSLDRDGARSRLSELAGGPTTPGVQQH